MPQELPFPAPRDLVRVRGDSWRVVDLERHADCAVCRLAGIRPSNRGVERALLLPFDRLVALPRSATLRRAGRRRFVAALGQLLATAPRYGCLRAAAAGRFDLLSYQLEPALAMLAGETRVLIADEVGLGKTVQASLVAAEIFARDPAARALVLAPASLCQQWTDELRSRFGLAAVHVDAAALHGLACLTPPDFSPWARVPLAIASFDYVKQPEVHAGMAGLPWDLLVVDEAHMVALAPERSRAVAALAQRARRVVLLTATPHAGGVDGFRALREAGRLPGDPPILMYRRTRAALGLPTTRRVAVLRVRLSTAERRMHAALDRYTRTVWRESAKRSNGADARLAMIVLRKRAASGAAALASSVSRRLSWLSVVGSNEAFQMSLPLEDAAGDPADDEPDLVLAAPGLPDVRAERRDLARLLDLAAAAAAEEAKPRVLRRLVDRCGEPVLVFTEYRDTLARLGDVLRPAASVALLHGGLDLAARDTSARSFTAGEARVLLATDAAAHGLNLQSRCRLVVNVELPWTPARLEQRIGRVDRIGQHRRVHAVHLVAAGTSEDEVLARLVFRLAQEREAVGDIANPLGFLAEAQVAKAIFATSPDSRLPVGRPPCRHREKTAIPADEACRTRSEANQSQAELERLRRVRAIASRCGLHGDPLRSGRGARLDPGAAAASSARSAPCWLVLRRGGELGGLAPGLWCVLVGTLLDGSGSLIEEVPFALHVDLDGRFLGRDVLEKDLPLLLRSCMDRLGNAAREVVLERAAEIRSALAASTRGLAIREAAMAAEAGRQTGPLQPGLFDRRAIKRAERDEARRLREKQWSQFELEALARAAVVEATAEPEIALVLGIAI